MLISLIVTSYDRQSDLDRFTAGLAQQTFPGEIELIYVAQGNAVLVIPASHCRISLKQYSTGGLTALSKARNLGLAHVRGDIIGFPDDDCWYGPNVLAEVARYFHEHPEIGCVGTNVYDPDRKLAYGKRPVGVICDVTFRNLFQLPISTGTFMRREALGNIGAHFDERYGVGTDLGSGEETELVGRLLSSSQRVHYVGTIQVYHAVPDYSAPDANKSYRYGIGFGYLNGALLREGHVAVLFHLIEVLARTSAGIALYCFSPAKRAVYLGRLRGTLVGLARSVTRNG